jgi:hypothetical protein
MKYIITVVFIAILIVSCKKESVENYNKTIYGKWGINKLKGIYWDANNNPEYDSVLMGSNSYSDFRTDGKIYSYTDISYNGPVLRVTPKYDTTIFHIKGNDTLITTDKQGNSNLFFIKDFTTDNITLYLIGSVGFGKYENWAYYSR